MAKFDLNIKYLCQDKDGSVHASIKEPYSDNDNGWYGCDIYFFEREANNNPNWRDTLIDLETDDYDFEDGILMRVEK